MICHSELCSESVYSTYVKEEQEQATRERRRGKFVFPCCLFLRQILKRV